MNTFFIKHFKKSLCHTRSFLVEIQLLEPALTNIVSEIYLTRLKIKKTNKQTQTYNASGFFDVYQVDMQIKRAVKEAAL